MFKCPVCKCPATIKLIKGWIGTDQMIRTCTRCKTKWLGVLHIEEGVAIAPSGKTIGIGVHPVTPTCLWRKDVSKNN